MASNNTEARRIMYKAAARVTDRGRQERHDNIEENRKIRRKQILQKKRREDLTASTSSATNQPLLDFSSWSLEKKVDSDDPIFTKYIRPPIDTDDERYEPLLHPRKLTLQNLSLGTKKSDIISFFERRASISLKRSQVRAEPVVKGEKTRTFMITLSDVAETRRAIRMHGELVRTRHIFVTRQMGDRRSVYVSGFSKGLGTADTKKELQEIFQGHATITSIYLPNDEFGYILVGKCDKHFQKALGKGSFRNGEAVITIRDAFMLPQILDEFSP